MGPRLDGWERRLDAVIIEDRPFEWGKSDCCKFAARCIKAMVGKDPSERWQYADEYGAGRVLRKYGGVDGVATFLFGPSKEPLTSNRGDLVMVEAPQRMLGICIGHLVAIQGSHGVEFVPLSSALKAWSI
jgi:hypothetical protein